MESDEQGLRHATDADEICFGMESLFRSDCPRVPYKVYISNEQFERFFIFLTGIERSRLRGLGGGGGGRWPDELYRVGEVLQDVEGREIAGEFDVVVQGAFRPPFLHLTLLF